MRAKPKKDQRKERNRNIRYGGFGVYSMAGAGAAMG